MVLRLWTTRVVPDREPVSLAYARTHFQPMFLAQKGCLGVCLLVRADGRHSAYSLWRDAAAPTAALPAPSGR